jgi:hypothetical protein
MLFVCVFLSIVFGLNCLVMSNLTVEDLNRALEEKLVPLRLRRKLKKQIQRLRL